MHTGYKDLKKCDLMVNDWNSIVLKYLDRSLIVMNARGALGLDDDTEIKFRTEDNVACDLKHLDTARNHHLRRRSVGDPNYK